MRISDWSSDVCPSDLKDVFHRRCAQAIEDARHTRRTLLLVLLDLDDFKAANDRAGHLAGDEILRAFAKGVSAIMRREDLIGRIGGDEFALLEIGEHTSELQSLMRISYAVFCLKKKPVEI